MQLSYSLLAFVAVIASVSAAPSAKSDYKRISTDGFLNQAWMSELQIHSIHADDDIKELVNQISAHCDSLPQCTGFSFNNYKNFYYRISYYRDTIDANNLKSQDAFVSPATDSGVFGVYEGKKQHDKKRDVEVKDNSLVKRETLYTYITRGQPDTAVNTNSFETGAQYSSLVGFVTIPIV